jgi:cobalt-zinc-cadmium efflux system outer membrane protein
VLALAPAGGLSGARAAAEEPAPAAAPAAPARPALAFDAYLGRVLQSNLELAAERFNVPVAEAQIAIAKIFPDPTLTGGIGSIDLSHVGAPNSTTLGLSETVELGGKRGARVAVARSGHAGARADLDDFLRTLRANAAGAFVDALHARMVLERKRLTLVSLERLVAVNRERMRAGDIGEVAVLQSRVEAERFRSEVVAAEADVRSADLGLGLLVGQGGPAAFTAAGDLKPETRAFDLARLIETARQARPDVVSKRYALDAGRSRVRLAHANRWIDLTLSVDWLHSGAGENDFLQPPFDALGATLSLPLPFSHIYRGELDAAIAGQSQAEWALRSVEVKAEVEVRQAFEKYRAAAERVAIYKSGVLDDADKVLAGTLYSYQRGAATLLEVLDAQRTDNEVHIAYADALADDAHALIALEQAAGIWDVRF